MILPAMHPSCLHAFLDLSQLLSAIGPHEATFLPLVKRIHVDYLMSTPPSFSVVSHTHPHRKSKLKREGKSRTLIACGEREWGPLRWQCSAFLGSRKG